MENLHTKAERYEWLLALLNQWVAEDEADPEQEDRMARLMESAIRDGRAAALTHPATVPEGHVLTPDGVLRKVLGTLPLTADGCVLGLNGNFHFAHENHMWGEPFVEVKNAGSLAMSWSQCEDPPTVDYRDDEGDEGQVCITRCYSTPEAAESAQQAAGGREGP